MALSLPGDSEPTILLSARSEVEEAHFDRPSAVATVIFCDKLKKAYEHLSGRGVLAGPIQDGGDMQFFEIRDAEGSLQISIKFPLSILELWIGYTRAIWPFGPPPSKGLR